MKTTHGGPAYVTSEAVDRALSAAEEMVKDDDEGNECSEETYNAACAYVMRQLLDPMASHLRPTQAVNARERFHGRASLGLAFCVQLVPAEQDGDPAHSGAGADSTLLPGWFRRWCRGWRRAAVITDIDDGSPAARAGIRRGDELLEVDGQPCAGRTRSAALEMLGYGAEGSAVSLTCRRREHVAAASTQRTVSLRRVAVPPATVRSRPLAHGTAHLLEISSFGSTTAAELRAELRALRRNRATPPATLVFDLRGNEGGLLPEAIAACRMVLPIGAHVISLRKEAPARVAIAYRRRWWHRCELPRLGSAAAASAACGGDAADADATSSGGGSSSSGGGSGGSSSSSGADGGVRLLPGSCAPLVVLVSHASASSAEVFAGALKHAGGAQIVGQQTYGKGSSQAVVYQRDGCAVSFTAYTLAVGARRGIRQLSNGVEPNVRWCWRAPRSVRAANDAEVERALSAAAVEWRLKQ